MSVIVGKRVRRLREAMDMTQADVRRFTNDVVTQAHLSKIENDKVPSVGSEILQALASLFQTNADYLMGASDDPRPPDRPKIPGELDAIEQELVEMYRSLPNQTSKSILISTVRTMVNKLVAIHEPEPVLEPRNGHGTTHAQDDA